MANKVQKHLRAESVSSGELTPAYLTRQEFGRRLYQLMLKKRWKQSELARQAGLPRDSISTYVRGKSLPTPPSLAALAKALDVEPEELLPNHTEDAIASTSLSTEMRVSSEDPRLAWLRVDRLVTTANAVKIVEILANDNAMDVGK